MLHNCFNKAVAKIFSVTDRRSIQYIKQNLILLNLEVVNEDRKKEVYGKLLLVNSFSYMTV